MRPRAPSVVLEVGEVFADRGLVLVDVVHEEPGRGQAAGLVDVDDGDPSHQMGRAVDAGAAVLPLGPAALLLVAGVAEVELQVGHGIEDHRPILSGLLAAGEAAGRVVRQLEPAVVGEAGHDGLGIMRRDGAAEVVDELLASGADHAYSLAYIHGNGEAPTGCRSPPQSPAAGGARSVQCA